VGGRAEGVGGRAEKDVQAEGHGGPKSDDDDNISLFLVVGLLNGHVDRLRRQDGIILGGSVTI
jgi:hypothetical protein